MTTPKKLTKTQLVALGTSIIAQGSLDSKIFETVVLPKAIALTTIAPVESDVNSLYIPLKKAMKVVKTIKTGVGAQILQHIADGVLSNKEIVTKVLEDNPLRKTTYACVAWYQSQVKAGKIDLPEAQEEVMMTEEELAEQE